MSEDLIRQEIQELKKSLRRENIDSKEDHGGGSDRVKLDRVIYRENLLDFASKKKEVMLLQYSLQVKQGEIDRMEEAVKAAEEKLVADEKQIEEESLLFDKYLKENDKSCVDAIKKAEAETKIRLDKIQELRRLNTQCQNFKNELMKNEDQLVVLQKYRDFFASLSKDGLSPSSPVSSDSELQFESPSQFLQILDNLEEANLSLIQSCQETDNLVEELKRQLSKTVSEGNLKLGQLKKAVDDANKLIAHENAKVCDLEKEINDSTMDGSRETNAQVLADLNTKVRAAYEQCIGKAEDGISTLFMLTALERKLEKLFDVLEAMPQDKVELAEKQREKERRQKVREEKLEEQKRVQEERAKKALDRALAASSPTKKVIDKKELYKPRLFKKATIHEDKVEAGSMVEEEIWRYLV